MKNVDNIILNSLRLISYDRSKHVTEQIAPTRSYKLDKPIIDLTPTQKPGRETVSEEKIPFITLKSIVSNKDIYLPVRKVEVEEEEKPVFPSTSIIPKSKFDFDPKIKIKKTKKVALIKPKILKNISSNEEYNQEIAEKYFGSQCLKLSGRHPKYDVGYYRKLDYYIDDSGNQCTPIPYKTITNKSSEIDVWQTDLSKPVTLKNGNTIQKSKLKYPQGCKPISYDFCLRFSWQNLNSLGSQNQGVLEFEKSEGSLKTQKVNYETYRGCISDEWFPWTNRFVGYLNKDKFKTSSDSAGVKQYTKCIAKGYSDTGVNIIEDHLKSYNLQSGIKTLLPIQYNEVEQFTLESAIKESTGSDYNIKGKYVDYKIDLNQWFTFGDKDYKTYESSVDVNFTDYLKGVEEKGDFYEEWLNNLYGKVDPKTGKRVGVGVEFVEKMINDEKTLTSLTVKWDDITKKYLGPNKDNTSELLLIISEEYNKEKKKTRPNELVLSFLENKWNQILEISKIYASKTSNKSINDFTLHYLEDIFGITNKEGDHAGFSINDFFSSPLDMFNKKEKEIKPKGFGVLKDNKTLMEYNKIPLMIPVDYKTYNKKNINPVTIEDLENRGISEGFKNGFLYKDQKVQIGGENLEVNRFLYSTLLSSSTETKTNENKGEMTDDDYKVLIKQWETYDKTIGDALNKTIVIIGR
jgi:hypothetical protein